MVERRTVQGISAKCRLLHLPDTGLATALAGLTANDWLSERPRMGHLLESFAVQQLMAQAAWADPTGPGVSRGEARRWLRRSVLLVLWPVAAHILLTIGENVTTLL